MMDVAILQDTTGLFDVAVSGPDLEADNGLRSAVLVSLFTDRHAEDDDVLPGNDDDRRGYWGDAWPDVPSHKIGSRLWLLAREKTTPEVLRRAQQYAAESLQWLVDDSIAKTVTVKTDWLRTGVMAVYVTITKGDENAFEDTFQFELSRAA